MGTDVHSLMSFSAAAALVVLDLALLAFFTRRLGRAASGAGLGLLAVMVLLKLALLALGVAWLSRQPWNVRPAMAAGLLLPFALFIVWQAVRLNLAARRRA